MNGRILIDRSITDHWIWTDANRLKWWLDLLMLANWEDQTRLIGRKRIKILRGQICASISYLQRRWSVCNHTVIDFLKMLEQDEMIHKDTHNNISVITICNYDTYQSISKEDAHNLAHRDAHNAENDEVHNVAHNLAHTLTPLVSEQREQEAQEAAHNLWNIPVHNPAHTIKESKINNILSTSTTTACACEEKSKEELYLEELRTSDIWVEQICMMFHLHKEDLTPRFEQFKLSNAVREIKHETLSDMKRHFTDWLRIVLSCENRQNQNHSNNATNRQDNKAQRRQAEVTATSAKSYEGNF